MKRLLAMSILVFIFVGNAYAPDVDKFVIAVHVECSDKITKDLIESYIKRELRSFSDVKIFRADGNLSHTHELILLAIETKSKITGNKTGNIIISAVFTESIRLLNILEPHLPVGTQMDIWRLIYRDKVLPDRYSNVINNIVYFTETNESHDACKKIVANFDTDVLEKAREKR